MRLGRLAFAAVLAVAAFGCGRRATREECEMVVERNIDLQLAAQGESGEAAVAKRAKLRAELEPSITACEGMRVRDSLMSCMRTADTPEKIKQCTPR